MTKWNASRRKRPEDLTDTASDSAPKPGDYALGSLQSRAAARAMLKEKETGKWVIKVHFGQELGRMAKVPFEVRDGPNATFEFYREEDDCKQQETNTESS